MKKLAFTQLVLMLALGIFFFSCNKEFSSLQTRDVEQQANSSAGHLKQTKTYSSDVVKRWLQVQTNMLYRPSGNPFGLNPVRYMGYFGVALYESVVPGMPAYQSLHGQLTDMPAMPSTSPGVGYHWPSAAHGALSVMTRKFFSTTAAYNAQAVLDLELELENTYRAEAGNAMYERSVAFGEEVADRIFAWAQSDQAAWPNMPYQLPTPYPGMWQPELPNGPIGFPYWGMNRLMVPGSIDNTISPPPPPYSNNPASPYYAEYNEVYQQSLINTHEQKLMARYYNDANPGYPAGAHYISIFKQVIEQFDPALDIAALSYAKAGISLYDISVGSFKGKFAYLNERPFQYIRSVIAPGAVPEWKPFIPTPPYPDFPSNHASFSASVAYALGSIYGSNIPFTNSSYEGVMADLGNGPENMGSRHYASFNDMAWEFGISRLYGGIHIRYAIEEGRKQGIKTAMNIDSKLKFKKE